MWSTEDEDLKEMAETMNEIFDETNISIVNI